MSLCGRYVCGGDDDDTWNVVHAGIDGQWGYCPKGRPLMDLCAVIEMAGDLPSNVMAAAAVVVVVVLVLGWLYLAPCSAAVSIKVWEAVKRCVEVHCFVHLPNPLSPPAPCPAWQQHRRDPQGRWVVVANSVWQGRRLAQSIAWSLVKWFPANMDAKQFLGASTVGLHLSSCCDNGVLLWPMMMRLMTMNLPNPSDSRRPPRQQLHCLDRMA